MSDNNKPSDLVTGQDKKPCGCTITTYSDKRQVVAPCVPCGLFAAAQNLAAAADAIGAVATTIRASHQASLIREVAKDTAKKTDGNNLRPLR